MNTLLQADIFFFVTTVVTIIVGVLVATVLVYTALLLKDLKHIARTVKNSTDSLADDVGDLRQEIRRKGVGIRSLVDFTKNIYKRRSKTKKK